MNAIQMLNDNIISDIIVFFFVIIDDIIAISASLLDCPISFKILTLPGQWCFIFEKIKFFFMFINCTFQFLSIFCFRLFILCTRYRHHFQEKIKVSISSKYNSSFIFLHVITFVIFIWYFHIFYNICNIFYNICNNW